MKKPEKLRIRAWFDGSCNPSDPSKPNGVMGLGAIVTIDKRTVFEYNEFVEDSPDNSSLLAEYMALLAVLNYLYYKNYLCANHDIEVCGDSKIIVDHMNNKKRFGRGNYINVALICKQILSKYGNRAVKIKWIPREWNKKADYLSKKAILDKKVVLKPTKS